MQRVDAILNGDNAATFGFLFKILTTSLTFAGGGVGGLITPVFFIGANAGYFFAHLLGLNTITFAALGLVSILAGVANTPLAASIMAMELFGADIAPYAAVSCIVSFLITGQRSLFDKQRFHFDKNFSDDDEDFDQTRPQLENKLRKRNFFLAMVRHLIPQENSAANPATKKENTISPKPKLSVPENKKETNKFEAKKTLTETLFGHLFPQENFEEKPKQNKDNSTNEKPTKKNGKI